MSHRNAAAAPKPPAELWAQMEAAGADGDDVRLGILQAQYHAWLAERGYTGQPHHGTTAPDTAYLPEPEEDA